MQDTWQAFLLQQGATIKDDVIDFDTSALNLKETALISPLSDFAMLAVEGNDRHLFLHGQLINDLNLIDQPAAQLSAWCNPKGQLITNFLIINTGTSYLLIFKRELKAFVQKRLTMFVMRSDVTINDISESSPLLGLANTSDLAILDENIPTEPGAVYAFDGLIIISHPDGSGRYLLTGSVEALINQLNVLKNQFMLVGSLIWSLLDILAGLPWITSATQEQYLPQMLNLDALKALSYKKGCYPGQEVIARLHYRGQVKKRLQLINTSQSLTVGDFIYLKESDNKIGTVINSGPHPDGLCYALAVIDSDKINEPLFADTKCVHDVSIMELPYAIDA
jgi:folate-binding protein YgfZ